MPNVEKFEEHLFSINGAKVRALIIKNRDFEPQKQGFSTTFLDVVDVNGG